MRSSTFREGREGGAHRQGHNAARGGNRRRRGGAQGCGVLLLPREHA